MKEKQLKPKKITRNKAYIKLLYAALYKNSMIYIRQIGSEVFEWLVVYKDQLYSSYMVFTLDRGVKKMTPQQVTAGTNLLIAGAMATIDTLLGEQVEGEAKEVAQVVALAGGDGLT